MIQNYINHIVFVIDASGSMSTFSRQVVRVFDNQIAHLAKRSQKLNQETRVSVYMFNTSTTCLIYDMDVMRLPSLENHYFTGGGTDLIGATLKSIDDLQETAQRYGDHAFLVYVLTDGEHNAGNKSARDLAKKLNSLPDNWTVATLVPNRHCAQDAKDFGFHATNVDIWDSTSEAGFEKFSNRTREVIDRYMDNRARGIRGTKSLFTVDTSNLTSRQVASQLDPLKRSEYELGNVRRDAAIRDFVEGNMGLDYVAGMAYYELTKPETVQRGKHICIRDDNTGRVYAGDNARSLLGLPKAEIRVKPDDFSNFTVFVQSTSHNRKLVGGTELLVIR